MRVCLHVGMFGCVCVHASLDVSEFSVCVCLCFCVCAPAGVSRGVWVYAPLSVWVYLDVRVLSERTPGESASGPRFMQHLF